MNVWKSFIIMEDVVPDWVKRTELFHHYGGCGSSIDESEEIFHHCEQDVVLA